MRVMVTGGTGFVGSHTTRALLESGHDVRLLVRSPEKVARIFGPAARACLEIVEGDVTDGRTVGPALEGCDAVFHAAGVVTLEAGRAAEVRATNTVGARQVIGGAHARGIRRLVYVSSASALYTPGLERIDETSPIGESRSAYSQSKAESERYIRELQSEGANISSTYPTAVVGPDDPGLSEGNHALAAGLRAAFFMTDTGFQQVDVRDLARIHVRLIEAGASGRFIAGGHYLDWADLADLLDRVGGGRIRRLRVPGRVLRAVGAVCDVVKRVLPFDFPITYETMTYATRWALVDSRKTLDELDLHFRPLEETLRDTLRWLVEAGHLDAKRAPALAAASV